MPAKTWDSTVEWGDYTLSDLEISDGELVISEGHNSGTATLTAPYEAASWDHWSKLTLSGSRPQGTNIYLRFRVGATAEACLIAEWSDYIDGLDADGAMIYDLRVHLLNSGVGDGGFCQFELTLVGE